MSYYNDANYVAVELAQLPVPAGFDSLPDFNMSMFHLTNMESQLLQVRAWTCSHHPVQLSGCMIKPPFQNVD